MMSAVRQMSSAVRPASGGIEMREQDPEVSYGETYGRPSGEFESEHPARGEPKEVRGAPEAKPLAGDGDAA